VLHPKDFPQLRLLALLAISASLIPITEQLLLKKTGTLPSSAVPDAARSNELTSVSQDEDFLSKTPGVKYTTSVIGFSLLSLVQNTYSAFFFVTFKPWSERTKPEEQYAAIKARLISTLGTLTKYRVCVSPPAIPRGTSGGSRCARRSRGKDVAFLAQKT